MLYSSGSRVMCKSRLPVIALELDYIGRVVW